MLRSVRVSLIAVLAMGGVAACGTTVPQVGAGEAATTGGLGVTHGTSGISGSTGVVGGPGAVGGGTVGTTGAVPGQPTGPSASGGPGGTTGLAPVTQRPLRIGIVGTDVAAIAAIFGRDPKASADPMVAARKIIADINKHGGIAGRKVESVSFMGDSAADGNSNGQRACSALTEDTKVDIVVNAGMLSDLFPSCLQSRGISVVDVYPLATDAVDMRRHPNWLMPQATRMDVSAPAILNMAMQRGVLKRGDTVGVLIEDCPWGQRVYNSSVVPAAAKLGVKLVQGTLKCIENLVADLGPLTNDIQRETLRFNTSGVTHVTTLSIAEAFVVAQFTGNASRQDYHPKYLVTSLAYPYGNSQDDAVIKISADALPNMHGLGYSPLFDVGDMARAANPAQLSAQKRCKRADPTQLGSESDDSSGRYFTRNSFYGLCDALYVVKALLEANGVKTSISEVVRGYRLALNGSLAAAQLAGGRFKVNAQHLDGVGFYRPFAYDVKNQRFAYVGSLAALS